MPPKSKNISSFALPNPRIHVVNYDEKKVEELKNISLEDCAKYARTPTVTWVNIDRTRESDLVNEVGEYFKLHHLTIKDMTHIDRRPRIEVFDDYIYVAVEMVNSSLKDGLHSEQVSFILKKNILLTVQEGKEGDAFTEVRRKIQNDQSRIRKMRGDYLLYALLLSILNTYFLTLENIGDRIEQLEDELISRPSKKTLNKIYILKREMIDIRKVVWPLREVIGALERDDFSYIQRSTQPYFRDLYEQTIHIIDTIETYREMISGMLDIYLSSVSNRLNEVMKVLTIISTIFMPLTFVAGIYGMNFRFMPELEWKFGYPFALGIMLVVSLLFLRFFRKKGWI